jgi:hypothetical protein
MLLKWLSSVRILLAKCSKYESRKIISTIPHNIIVVSVGKDVLQVMLKVNGGKEIYSLHLVGTQ